MLRLVADFTTTSLFPIKATVNHIIPVKLVMIPLALSMQDFMPYQICTFFKPFSTN